VDIQDFVGSLKLQWGNKIKLQVFFSFNWIVIYGTTEICILCLIYLIYRMCPQAVATQHESVKIEFLRMLVALRV